MITIGDLIVVVSQIALEAGKTEAEGYELASLTLTKILTFGDPQRFDTLEELIEALYSHIHYFTEYRIKNRLRMSPAQFRRKWEAEQQTLKSQASSQVMSLPPDPPHSRTQQLRLIQNSFSQLTATTTFFN